MGRASLFGYIPLRKGPGGLGLIVIDSSLFACVFAMVRSEVDRRSRELQGGEFGTRRPSQSLVNLMDKTRPEQ
jgi:hypothetical protein